MNNKVGFFRILLKKSLSVILCFVLALAALPLTEIGLFDIKRN